MIRKNVAIVGGGPVGLTAALFMEKLGLSYALIERNKTLMSHPAAHLLNLRTMETLAELSCPRTHLPLNKVIYDKCEDMEYFRYYRYQRRLLGQQGIFHVEDHFSPSAKVKQADILSKHAFTRYVHMPQPRFVEVLKDSLQCTADSLFLGRTVKGFKQQSDGVELTIQGQSSSTEVIKADFVIACDGKHSQIRQQCGIGLVGNSHLQSFLNVYFHSQKLADAIDSAQQNAMLHFIYNSDVIACLVNHSKKDGMFVMQVPVAPPYDDLSGLSETAKHQKARQLVRFLLDADQRNLIDDSDIDVKSVGIWKLSSEVIEKYYSGRVIFAGDSAHAFPPAGGFGMNTGLQEVHSLAHKLRLIYSSIDPSQTEKILATYESERKQFVTEILNTANKNYKLSLDIAKHLGLSVENYFSAHRAANLASSVLPTSLMSHLWKAVVKVGSLPVEKVNVESVQRKLSVPGATVPLIFFKEDTEFKYDAGFIGTSNVAAESKKLSGQLLPHVLITYQGEELALRQLSLKVNSSMSARTQSIVYTNPSQGIENISQHVNYMLVLHREQLNEEKFQTFINSLKDLFVKPEIIYSVQLSDASFLKTEDIQKIFSENNQIVLVRSDSHIFARYDMTV